MSRTVTPPVRLLLVGAGHTHLEVVTRSGELREAGYRVRLLAPATFHYSGMASATAAGSLPGGSGTVDVVALARAHAVEHVVSTLVGLDLDARTATTSTGAVLEYDVVSLNLGSVVAEHGVEVDPAVVRVKPLADLADLTERLEVLGGAARVTVVGAGSTGLEMAAHLATRADVATVRIVESGDRLGPDLPPGAARRVLRLLERRGVEVRLGCRVVAIGPDRLQCEDGSVVEHDVALLASGLVAPPLVAALGLGTDAGVPVGATLQHVERDEVYAVGDCALFTPSPLPRVGVHGVRQAGVLVGSLLARVRDQELPVYRPQRHALAVLDLGGGAALAVRGRWWVYGSAALRLKRVIDMRWLRRYGG